MCADRKKANVNARVPRAVEFCLKAEVSSRVYVAGSFNNWNATAHPLSYDRDSGVFRATVDLPPGTYEYKFLVDGVWCIDPDGPDWTSNEFGSLNSLIHVK